jgi:hypothetical protein
MHLAQNLAVAQLAEVKVALLLNVVDVQLHSRDLAPQLLHLLPTTSTSTRLACARRCARRRRRLARRCRNKQNIHSTSFSATFFDSNCSSAKRWSAVATVAKTKEAEEAFHGAEEGEESSRQL